MRIPVMLILRWPVWWLVALGCTLLLARCDSLDEATVLDEALQARLGRASGGKGASAFILPRSDDFAALPQDPNNPLTPEKVRLGRLLFHETGLLTEPKRAQGRFTSSCAACHHVQGGFQANLPQGIGEGGVGFGRRGEGRRNDPAYGNDLDVQPIRTPSALNAAYQEVMLWNGQFGARGVNEGTEAQWTEGTPKAVNRLGYEGLETQAIAALSVHRMGAFDTAAVAEHARYRQLFAAAYPEVPSAERVTRERAGLAIAAYERTLLAREAPFQRWLRGDLGAMTEAEKRGALLFFGKAACVTCHTGPALSSMTFHALGMRDLAGQGVYGDFSADTTTHLGRGGFTGREEDRYRFKTPQLYNLADSPFYGHGAEFRTLRDVVAYKNEAVPSNPAVPAARLAAGFRPLGLSEQEVDDLTQFLQHALRDPNLTRYAPRRLPTGRCFPVNDAQSRVDLGC